MDSPQTTDERCEHTKVFVTDSTMRRNQVPCPWCRDAEIERLRNHIFNGVDLLQWYLDRYGSTDSQSHEARVWIATEIRRDP